MLHYDHLHMMDSIKHGDYPGTHRYLLYVNPNKLISGKRNTYLMIASGSNKGNLAVVDLLLGAGANPHLQNLDGNTALMIAAQYGKSAIVRRFLEIGVDPSIEDNEGNTALILAVNANQLGIVEDLLDAGMNVNHKDHNDRTALDYAVAKECVPLIKVLLDAGTDLSMQHKNGLVVLDIAIVRGNPKIINLLLDYKPKDPDDVDDNGATVLMGHCLGGPFYQFVSLLSRSKNINQQDITGNTALHYAASLGDYKRIEALLIAGANPYLHNGEGNTPIQSIILTPKIQMLLRNYNAKQALIKKCGISLDVWNLITPYLIH